MTPTRVRPPFVSSVVMVALLVGAVNAEAQQPTEPDLSLEALMRVSIEPVFGASLRLQPMTEAPSSVTIVTADDIARHGYQTLSDVLAAVRGFHVTGDRNYSYVGARGFALPGDYNTRVLLLVDGHRMNDAIFEQATTGRELALDIASISRVEVIRGPASALYGTSAFFAVVNIITRSGAAVAGLTASGQMGSLGSQVVRLAAGRAFENGLDVSVAGIVGRSDGADELYFPAFDTPETGHGLATGLDREDHRQLVARLRFGAFSVSGAAASRDKQVPTAAYDTAFGDPRLTTTDARAYVHARYERQLAGYQVAMQASFDRYRYDGTYPYWTDDTPDSDITLEQDFAEARWWSADGRISRLMASRHMVTAGTEFRQTIREEQGGVYAADPESDFLISNRSRVVAVYGQDEVTVGRHLLLTAGLRYDRYAGFSRVTPRFAVVVKTSEDQAFKYLFGNAFRAPNAYELDYYSHPERRLDLRPETIRSHEVAWERYSGRWLRTSASAYLNTIDDLITFSGTDRDNYGFENVGRVRSRGMEFEIEARHRSGVRGVVSYVLQDAVDRATDLYLTNSPRHAVTAQASSPAPLGSTASIGLHYLSRRLTLDGDSVDPVYLANLTVRLPLGHGFQITGLVKNLLDERYEDPGSSEHRQHAIPQDGRTVLINLEWNARRGSDRSRTAVP